MSNLFVHAVGGEGPNGCRQRKWQLSVDCNSQTIIDVNSEIYRNHDIPSIKKAHIHNLPLAEIIFDD